MVFIALLLTIFSYLIFPIVYVKTKGKVSNKKAKLLALLNSIVCTVIFEIIGIIAGIEPPLGGARFAPAIIYYPIAYCILSEKANKQEKIDENQETKENL